MYDWKEIKNENELLMLLSLEKSYQSTQKNWKNWNYENEELSKNERKTEKAYLYTYMNKHFNLKAFL